MWEKKIVDCLIPSNYTISLLTNEKRIMVFYRFNQILILSGLYYVVSSFFILANGNLNKAVACCFPIFLSIIIALMFFKQFSWVEKLSKKVPNIVFLLKILGVYIFIYFFTNISGIILRYLDERGFSLGLYSIYEEWGEPVNAVIDIVFFFVLVIALLVILIKNTGKVSGS